MSVRRIVHLFTFTIYLQMKVCSYREVNKQYVIKMTKCSVLDYQSHPYLKNTYSTAGKERRCLIIKFNASAS